MKLIHDFYRIEQVNGGETEFEYTLSLNKDHFIYKAHFPGNPVTPGVCIIQLCKELMEFRLEKLFFLKKIVNVKFLSVINPLVLEHIQVTFSKIVPMEEGYKFSALVHWESTIFAKLNLHLQAFNI
jgi:3-hydroxyacyl-[acyl-carrier-protein] dehydratase